VRYWLALICALIAAPAQAQIPQPAIVTSDGPASVAVSLYRNPGRGENDAIELEYLQGFALISETRVVDLPPGIVTIRFEGVASGIQPETAIVTGTDIREKNRDRMLLSQRGLLDAFTGQRVVIKRTNPKTGVVTQESGTIRSGSDRVILQTKEGFEALYCNYKNETLLFPGIPPGLTAKPTLSVKTRNQPGGKQTVTLTYLADKFDWQANYVGELAPDAKSINLTAWLTMASGDDTSFNDASAYAIAGKLERQESGDSNAAENEYSAENIEVYFQCWPFGTTTTDLNQVIPPPPTIATYAPVAVSMISAEAMVAQDIIVTAQKRSTVAEQEDLGDLKLYRIPFPVTVAARAQKQVVFLKKQAVPGDLIYRSKVNGSDYGDVEMLFRVLNKKEFGLGEALPAGKIAFFQTAGGRRMLVGESSVMDKAVGEEVEFPFATASNVSVAIDETGSDKKSSSYAMTVINANPFPVTFEAEFGPDDYSRHEKFTAKVIRKKGKTIWSIIVPANGEQELSYRNTRIVAEDE
jgi:hypothetical protein